MGHDISGFNKAGEEIAYARFSMGNYNAIKLYNLLDVNEYYAGVSGSGDIATFSIHQIESALNAYSETSHCINDFIDQRQILEFIQKCLSTAKKEGCVRVYFG